MADPTGENKLPGENECPDSCSDAERMRLRATDSVPVGRSTLAVVAFMVAIASFLLLPGLIRTSSKFTPRLIRETYSLVTFGTAVLAALLGVVSSVRIGLSGGRLTGKGLAWTGVAVPVVQYLLFLGVVLPLTPRSLAFTMTCGTNLSGIGKAMLIYDDELPRAGDRNATWGSTVWNARDRFAAYSISATASKASVSSALYLLVKCAEVTPKSFLCTGDKQATEFKPSRYGTRGELIDLWDFGPNPPQHVSYAYHMPFSVYALTTSSEPGLAVAADRNPWMDSPFAKARDFSKFKPDVASFNGTLDQALAGNASGHKGEGQNVLYLDTHVDFTKRSYCSLGDDNIYTSWDGDDKIRGKPPAFGSQPATRIDSLLVNDPAVPPR